MREQTARGRDTSDELTEVRTVLSRAMDARATLWRYQVGQLRYAGHWEYPPGERARYIEPDQEAARDPDLAEMIEALDETILRLLRWRRTGRARKEKKS